MFFTVPPMKGKKFIQDISYDYKTDSFDSYARALDYMKNYDTLLKGENEMKYDTIHRNRSILIVRNGYNEAKYIFNQLERMLNDRKVVTENDLRDLLELPTHVEGAYWGWRSLDGMKFNNNRGYDGEKFYTISLPMMISLVTMERKNVWFPSFTIGKVKINQVKITRDWQGAMDMYFHEKQEAEEVLGCLRRLIMDNDHAKIADAYDLVGEEQGLGDEAYQNGWKDLKDARIYGITTYECDDNRGRRFVLKLPKPVSVIYDPMKEYCPKPSFMTRDKRQHLTLKDVEEFSKSGDEFALKYEPENPRSIWKTFKILDGKFFWKKPNGDFEKGLQPLSVMFEAEFARIAKIKKFSDLWIPKIGDRYWYLYMDGDGSTFPINCVWDGDSNDLTRLYWDNVFEDRTDCKNDSYILRSLGELRERYKK